MNDPFKVCDGELISIVSTLCLYFLTFSLFSVFRKFVNLWTVVCSLQPITARSQILFKTYRPNNIAVSPCWHELGVQVSVTQTHAEQRGKQHRGCNMLSGWVHTKPSVMAPSCRIMWRCSLSLVESRRRGQLWKLLFANSNELLVPKSRPSTSRPWDLISERAWTVVNGKRQIIFWSRLNCTTNLKSDVCHFKKYFCMSRELQFIKRPLKYKILKTYI